VTQDFPEHDPDQNEPVDVIEAEGAEDAPADDDGMDVEALLEELAQWKDRALRAAADADNIRRRAERETNDARAYAIQRFAKDLLGVADNLTRAMGAAPRDSLDAQTQGLVTGLEMTEKALLAAFEANGLSRLAPEAGERFDPNQHQAMMEQVSDQHEAGQVTALLQPGYALFGRVLRPAMVAVAAKGSGTGIVGEGGASTSAASGAAAYQKVARDTGQTS
jgi:molecular chaperone GrpE